MVNKLFIHCNTPQFTELETTTINGKRWYKLPSGVKYPSVTTVLGAKEKEGLIEWENALGKEKATKEKNRCADRGEKVHKMAELYLDNDPNYAANQTEANIALFNKLKFALKNINNIRVQEIPLYSDVLKLAGRVDLIAEYSNVLSVIDFKTSNNHKEGELIEDYKLQCTAYALMYYEMFGILIEQIVILITVEKGIVPLVFKDSIHPYIKPLQERIALFNEK